MESVEDVRRSVRIARMTVGWTSNASARIACDSCQTAVGQNGPVGIAGFHFAIRILSSGQSLSAAGQHGLGSRQHECEGRAGAGRAGDLDAAPVQLDERLDQPEPQPMPRLPNW